MMLLRSLRLLSLYSLLCFCGGVGHCVETMTRADLSALIVPPYALGERVNEKGVWTLLNSGGAPAGYAFETEPLAPLPGFSGAPINVLVLFDLKGMFIDARLIAHCEPIFVSGLGQAPFHEFISQYRGLSINSSLVVGTPYGAAEGASGLVYLDGVIKATASVRIAHESILAATLQVAREKMQGVAAGPPAFPNTDYEEELSWNDLVAQGLVGHLRVTNAEMQDAFAGTKWAEDDAEAQDFPEDIYLDFWIVDVGPKSIARAVFEQETLEELDHFLSISASDEPLLFIETARHGLVSENFVRNTAPDLIGLEQNGFPVALRDADLFVSLRKDVPDGVALVLRTDRRLGFDPASPWRVTVTASRSHGMFQPEIGTLALTLDHQTDGRFFKRAETIAPLAPWREAILNRKTDLIILLVFSIPMVIAFWVRQSWMANIATMIPVRLVFLAFLVVFLGWWGQGQLSIVTVIATLRTAVDGQSFSYLLYDPFSLVIWAIAIFGFVLWGRGLFCGWFCPFGALQEISYYVARGLKLPEVKVSDHLDQRLKYLKYVLLTSLLSVVFIWPAYTDRFAEIEPFKTAITVYFVWEWYYVAYAGFWLLLGAVVFKGFCRYVCPLGAVMALGGLLRGRDWVARRAECGSPCQLCRVKCNYGAINQTGKIAYSECFQFLDCVKIYDSEKTCVPLILRARAPTRGKKPT